MKHLRYYLFTALVLFMAANLTAQDDRPSYCDALPNTYSKGASRRPSLPKFSTTPTSEYKIQVAILSNTDPRDYPFHDALVARYRPCEQVWVIESRESFANRNEALRLRNQLREMGYRGAYLVELVGYQ